MLSLILLVLAFVCFLIATFFPTYVTANPPQVRFRFNFIAFGLACWVLSLILSNHSIVR